MEAEDHKHGVALLFGAALVTIAAQTTVKAVRDGVFLSHFSIAQLTFAMVATAALAALLIPAFNRLARGVGRARVIAVTFGTIALTLIPIGWALRHHPSPWLAWTLYVWSSLFTLVTVVELWLLANDLFDAYTARRAFSVIGVGAILGGIAGGVSSRLLVDRLGTPRLLHMVAGELLLAAILCGMAWRFRPSTVIRPEPSQVDEVPRRYLRSLAWMFGSMTVAVTLTGWQMRGIAKTHFSSSQDALTHFFATLAIVVGVLTLAFQWFVTPRLLKRFGTGACLYALPAACALGAIGFLTARWPLLYTAAALMVLVDGLEFSLNNAASELMYAPLSEGARDRGKRFIDTVVDRAAGAGAGLLWLLLNWRFHLDQPGHLPQVSWAVLAVIAVWLITIGRGRKAYLETFRAVISADAPAPRTANPRMRIRALRRLARLDCEASARTQLLRSLAKIHRRSPQLGITWEVVEPLIEREVQLIADLRTARATVEQNRWRTLERLVDEETNRAMERIARLLAVVHPPADVVAVHRALRGHTVGVRAAALHVLEAMVEGPVRARLLEVLEAEALHQPLVGDPADGLRLLMSLDEPRLRACTVWSAAQAGMLHGELRQLALSDSSRRVRAAALFGIAIRKRATPPRRAAA